LRNQLEKLMQELRKRGFGQGQQGQGEMDQLQLTASSSAAVIFEAALPAPQPATRLPRRGSEDAGKHFWAAYRRSGDRP
jgi:hypothetical protein